MNGKELTMRFVEINRRNGAHRVQSYLDQYIYFAYWGSILLYEIYALFEHRLCDIFFIIRLVKAKRQFMMIM